MNVQKQKLLQRLEADAAKNKGRRMGRLQQTAWGFAMATGAVPAFAASTTGSSFLTAITDFARSPFMIGMCIVAVVLGVFMAIGGNVKAAFVPFGLAAIVALGPWIVDMIFTVFSTVN